MQRLGLGVPLLSHDEGGGLSGVGGLPSAGLTSSVGQEVQDASFV